MIGKTNAASGEAKKYVTLTLWWSLGIDFSLSDKTSVVYKGEHGYVSIDPHVNGNGSYQYTVEQGSLVTIYFNAYYGSGTPGISLGGEYTDVDFHSDSQPGRTIIYRAFVATGDCSIDASAFG